MKTNIIKIILLTFIAIFLLGILIVLLTKNKIWNIDFGSKEDYYQEETFSINKTDIIIDTISADIEIKKSKDELIHVELFGKEENDFIIEDKDYLKIEERKKHHICIGFCFYNKHIVVYLPESYIANLEFNTVSGDVTAENDFITKTKINTTSGDINLRNTKEVDIKTVSGEIKVESATKLDLKTTSGDVDIENAKLESDSSINTVSGEVRIRKINDVYVDTNTVSGDVKIDNNNRHAEIELKIKTTSGDITIK